MKKFALSPRVALIVLGTGAWLCAVSGARAEPVAHAIEPSITTGPRAWALATTAILTHRNGQRLDMLSPDARSDSSLTKVRSILHDWWGIDDRFDLLQTLERLRQEGHRLEFQRQGQSLLAMTEGQYQRLLATRTRPDDARRLKLVRDHYQRFGRNSLVAWDYCRYIMLCRWGYMLGFLAEGEAWRRIMPAARAIQSGFGSWAELGEDYLVGREFWSQEETARTGPMYRDIEARLVHEPRSPWNELPWGMELRASGSSSARLAPGQR